jgi:hypothetical protein
MCVVKTTDQSGAVSQTNLNLKVLNIKYQRKKYALSSTCTLLAGSDSTNLSSTMAFCSHAAKSVGATAEAATF